MTTKTDTREQDEINIDEKIENSLDLTDPDEPVIRFTPKQIANKGADLVRNYRNNKTEFGEIEPEYLLGFRNNDCADLSEYAELGFPHPKPQGYYKISFDDEMKPKGDKEFIQIYEDITRTNKIDDPILLYFHRGRILVLNGMTRLSIIGQHRQIRPGFMRRVPFRIFVGSENLARGEMVRLNLDGRQRVIKPKEFFTMIHAFRSNNMTVGEIRKMISGSATGNYEINNTINVAYFGCDRLIELFLAKKIPLGHASEIANVEDTGKQAIILENLKKNDTLGKVKLITRGKAAITPMITELLTKVRKLREAAENIGIYNHCEDDIEAMESALDNLKIVVEKADEDAMQAISDHIHFSEEDDGKGSDELEGIAEDVEQDEGLADESDATETLLRLDAEKSISTQKKTRAPRKNKGVKKDIPDESYGFDNQLNGNGQIDTTKVSKDEIEKFIQLWWKKYSSRPVDTPALLEIVEENKCFKFMRQLSSKKQTRSIWIAKNILSTLAGPKNAIGNYYWMRGVHYNKAHWKLQIL